MDEQALSLVSLKKKTTCIKNMAMVSFDDFQYIFVMSIQELSISCLI